MENPVYCRTEKWMRKKRKIMAFWAFNSARKNKKYDFAYIYVHSTI